jgi:hypothetical protein
MRDVKSGSAVRAFGVVALPFLMVAGVGSANATLMSSVTTRGGAIAGCSTTSNTGTLQTSCSNPEFSNVTINASGSPLLSSPNMTASIHVVNTSIPVDMTLDVQQSGIVSYTGPLIIDMSLTGPSNQYRLEVDSPVGTVIVSHALGGSGSFHDIINATITGVEELKFPFFFEFGSGTIDASISVSTPSAAVPEPISLSVLATGLIFLGLTKSRKFLQTVTPARKADG